MLVYEFRKQETLKIHQASLFQTIDGALGD